MLAIGAQPSRVHFSRDIFDNPRHPCTRALLRSALTVEPGAGLPYAGIRGSFPDPLDPPIGCHFHPRCPDEHRLSHAAPRARS